LNFTTTTGTKININLENKELSRRYLTSTFSSVSLSVYRRVMSNLQASTVNEKYTKK